MLQSIISRSILKLMEAWLNEIPVTSSDSFINELLKKSETIDRSPEVTRHFNQNEEYFLTLSSEFTVPGFPIHHDIEKKEPEKEYIESLRTLTEQIIPLAPRLFRGLTYYFNPTDILKPAFFQIYRLKDQLFLYLLQIDVTLRTQYGTIIGKGGNDKTHTFKTRSLFLENDLIPLKSYTEENGKFRSFLIEQLVTKTWIGERGQGYFQHGIWIDQELTKFFSKLFLPKGKRTYPFYPFPCKYRTLCHSVLNFDPEGRKRHLSNLFRARSFLLPYFDEIQNTLREENFREDLPLFIKLKEKVPEKWNDVWNPLSVKTYLNEKDMKEFIVDYPPV